MLSVLLFPTSGGLCVQGEFSPYRCKQPAGSKVEAGVRGHRVGRQRQRIWV